MAVVAINAIPQRSGAFGALGRRIYTRMFIARTDDSDDGPHTVRTWAGVPQIGEIYSTPGEADIGARVIDVNVEPLEGHGNYWSIEVTYDTQQQQSQDEQQANPGGHPLLDEPDISIRTSARSEQAVSAEGTVEGIFDKDIRNAAGAVFDPPPVKDENGLVASITRNEATLNFAQILDYQNVMNSDVFSGEAEKTFKLSITAADKLIRNDVTYYRKTYELEYRKDTWDLSILEAGSYALVAAGSTTREVFDDKHGVSGPIHLLLAADGTKLAPQTLDPVFTDFVIYRKRPFGVLNLPDLLLE